MNRKKIGYYDYTVVLTYMGMLFAFTGILQAVNDRYWDAVVCMILAGVCDMFDGAVASTKKDRDNMAKSFGVQIDSLSDLLSFGVLPGLTVYMIAEKSKVAGVVAGAYTLCALIRLAYYNVLEAERQKVETVPRKSFLGLPVTSIAILLPAFFVLYNEGVFKSVLPFLLLLGVVAIGFITPVEIKKPQAVGKICLVIVGIVELIGMFLVFAWGAV